ncbi:MAG: ATP-binding protein [Propioniciclava sp.]|uniref:ATP-binding protein n=1 Tax=Propioniciclava sp. TaxID=2038686 RepID=UPI0039E326DB
MDTSVTLERFVRRRVVEALADTRIVVLQGARQVGKSTLAEVVARPREALVVTLDDPDARVFAETDPVGFVTQTPGKLLVIDELQRVPELVIAMKAAVDRDKRPGQFLVTGSANLLDLAATHESLAGRAESVELHSFSQGELSGIRSSFIDATFAGRSFTGFESALTRRDYIDRACAGGYPEALQRESAPRRKAWYDNYLSQIVRRDAADITGLQRLAELPRILRLIAARSGATMVWSSLANDTEIPRRTLEPYIRLLETLYLINVLPAWSANLTSREVKQPKVFLSDSGLAASLLGLTPETATTAPAYAQLGGLLEGFVVGELRRQIGWSEQQPTMGHYRDSRNTEVDIVLESPDGRVVALEVKASATIQRKDLTGLSHLRDRLGDRFLGGYIACTAPRARLVGERLTMLPIGALWQS